MKFNVSKALQRQKELADLMKDCTPTEYNLYNAEYYSLEEGLAAVSYMDRIEETVLAHYDFPCLLNGYMDAHGNYAPPRVFEQMKSTGDNTMKITELEIHGYERVVRGVDESVGLDAIIAVHNTNLGPALGGCRMMKYDSYEDHLADALALSKGMTYKNSIAGLALGGGKSVINIKASGGEKPEALIKSFCKLLDYVNADRQIYITAGDIGSGPRELALMAKYTKNVQGADGSDSGVATGYGVFNAILGAFEARKIEVEGSTIAINGCGKVGRRLAGFLHERGAKLIVADALDFAAISLAEELGDRVTVVSHKDIHRSVCDVYAPCAVGGAVNEYTIDELRCAFVIGGANNQLATADMGQRLMDRGITYVPDYISNAGGVIIIEKRGHDYVDVEYDHPEVKRKLEDIGVTVKKILRESDATGVEPALVADRMAEGIWKRHDEWAVFGGAMVG